MSDLMVNSPTLINLITLNIESEANFSVAVGALNRGKLTKPIH